jgi:hypothetical protein
MYVDENGHYNLREDLANDSNRFLCVTGLVMKLAGYEKLEAKLNELKIKHFGTEEIILHRRELIAGKYPFESLKDPHKRMAFNADLLKIITDVKFGLISVVIDKKSLVEKHTILKAQDPYALALEYLMQRYLYWMQEYKVCGDILAESRGGREDTITKETYRLIYQGKGYNPLVNADKYFSSKELKLSKKKSNNAGLQIVDLISHPARRHILMQNGLAKNIIPTSFEQSIVEILIQSKFRKSANGLIDGYGTVFYPK